MKQMHGYSDGSTRSGGTIRGLEREDLLQHNASLSYQRSGGVTWRKPISLSLQHTYLEVVGDRQKLFQHKIQLLAWASKISKTSIRNYSVSCAIIVLQSFSVLGR